MPDEVAVVSTPAAVTNGAAPPAAEAPKAPTETRNTKTYQTGPKARGIAAKQPVPPPAEPPPEQMTPPAPTDHPASANGADHQAPAVAAPAATANGEAKGEPGKIDDLEVAKRLGALNRAEGKLAEEKRAHAGRLAVADVVSEAWGGKTPAPEQVRTVLQQAAMVYQGRQMAAKDPIGFLHRVFGVDPRVTMQHAVDGAIAEAAKKPEERQSEELQALRDKVAGFEQQIAKGEQEHAKQQQTRNVNEYIERTLEPIVSDANAFRHIRAYCEMNRAQPARELYNAMVERFRATGKAPEPRALAEEIERSLEGHFRKLNGSSAKPGQVAAPTKAETPPASTVSRRAVTSEPLRVRQKVGVKPYSTKPLG